MLLAAMTEGFGLLLLAPMLTALGGNAASSGIGQWIAKAGIPIEIGPLLAIFAGLVLLRAAVNLARDLESDVLRIHRVHLAVVEMEERHRRVVAERAACDLRGN